MGQTSEDGFWEFVEGEWSPTQKQQDALQQGAIGHDEKEIPREIETPSDANIHTQPLLTHQHQPAVKNDHFVIVSSSNDDGTKKALMVGAGIVTVLLLLVIVSGVLYVWASSLAEGQDPNLVGDWTNPEDTLQLMSNGDAKETTGTFETWYTINDTLYFEDDDYYYTYKYLIVDDVLFLAPLDEGDVLIEEDCIAYLEGSRGESQSFYNNRIEQAESDGDFPNWCNSE